MWHGSELVAVHARSFQPYAVVTNPTHFDGLWRRPATSALEPQVSALAAMGRTLADYAAVVGGAA